MGETRVDLLHLLEDLADAYPGELEETVLTEIVANSLDSGAATIALVPDASTATLTVMDDGSGMRRSDLRRFHDIASSSKERGKGIGFAGVGIKLGLLLSEEVLTETRRGREHAATSWALANRRRAPWRWIEPPGLVGETGTAVRLKLANPLSPLLDRGYLDSTLRRHFEPLFDPFFDTILGAHYPRGVRFAIGSETVERRNEATGEWVPIELRLPRKRIPSAFGYLGRSDGPAAQDRRGIAISTFGKVIKRGWDWLGIAPVGGERITGLVEVPSLAAALTLNKVDFIRSGPRGALFLTYRKTLQEAVMSQLALWGDSPESDERSRRRVARPVERDLAQILEGLSTRFPMLAALVEKHPGGKRKMPVLGADGKGSAGDAVPDLFTSPAGGSGAASAGAAPDAGGQPGVETPAAVEEGAAPPPAAATSVPPVGGGGGAARVKRPVRLGLSIQFESRPGDREMARLIESTVWVNDAHPAHRRAVASRSEGYHLALSVALALSEVAVARPEQRSFVTDFLAMWGETVERKGRRRRAVQRKKRSS